MNSDSQNYCDLLWQYKELVDDQNQLLDDQELICECFLVGVADIRDELKNSNLLINSDELPKWCFEHLKLGHGCGNCLKNQDEWKHRIVRNETLIESQTGPKE